MDALPMEALARDGWANAPLAPVALLAATIAARAPHASGLEERALGAEFGLDGFGVGLTRLAPGASVPRPGGRDRFVYVLEGEATVVFGADETALTPGLCLGLPADDGVAVLVNRGDRPVLVFEVSDRHAKA